MDACGWPVGPIREAANRGLWSHGYKSLNHCGNVSAAIGAGQRALRRKNADWVAIELFRRQALRASAGESLVTRRHNTYRGAFRDTCN
jgi:hypothetical protein